MKKNKGILAIVIIVVLIIVVALIVNGGSNDANNDVKELTTEAVTEAATEAVSADQADQGSAPAQTDNQTENPVPSEAQSFFDDYTNLQNEASRKVDTGAISETDYIDFLQKGVEVAQLKEEYEKNGDTEALNKGIDELKPYFYDVAKKIDSELADKFE